MALNATKFIRYGGLTVTGPYSLGSNSYELQQNIVSDDDPARNGIDGFFNSLSIVSAFAGAIVRVGEEVRDQRITVVDPTYTAVRNSEKVAEALGKVAKIAKKIPVTTIKKIGDGLDKTADGYQARAKAIETKIYDVRIKVEEIEAKFEAWAKYLKPIKDASLVKIPLAQSITLALYDLASENYDAMLTVTEEERAAFDDLLVGMFVRDDVAPSTASPALSPLASGTSAPGLEPGPSPEFDLEESAAAALAEAFAVWDARMEDRGAAIAAVNEVVEQIFAIIDRLSGDADLTASLQKLQEWLDALDALTAFDEITDLLAPLDTVAEAISGIYDEIEPVLDAMFLLSDVLDPLISAAEKKLGLSKLADEITDAIVEPVLEQLDDFALISIPEVDISLLEDYVNLWGWVDELTVRYDALLRTAEVTTAPVAGDIADVMSGSSIIFGQ
ncbi:MAG: hypothetical protein V2J13_11005, partial [Cycloclasticus sp.]|nr:hypothetical protein [Cycloclasticus sp.]